MQVVQFAQPKSRERMAATFDGRVGPNNEKNKKGQPGFRMSV
jgi:hypothetical protein